MSKARGILALLLVASVMGLAGCLSDESSQAPSASPQPEATRTIVPTLRPDKPHQPDKTPTSNASRQPISSRQIVSSTLHLRERWRISSGNRLGGGRAFLTIQIY